MVESVHRGSGPISRNVGAEDEEGVVLQREMGLVSGISLIVGRTTVQLIVLSEQCVSIFFLKYTQQEQLWDPEYGRLRARPCGHLGE